MMVIITTTTSLGTIITTTSLGRIAIAVSHQRARVQSLLVASRRRQVGHLAVEVIVVTGGQGMGGKTPRAQSLGPNLQASLRKA